MSTTASSPTMTTTMASSGGAAAAFAEQSFDGLTWPDYLVIALYFIFVLAVGLIVSG